MQGDQVWFLVDNSVKFIYSVFCKHFRVKVVFVLVEWLWKHFVGCFSFTDNCWSFNKCIYQPIFLFIDLYFIFLTYLLLYQFTVNLYTLSYLNEMLAMLWMEVLEFCMHFVCITVTLCLIVFYKYGKFVPHHERPSQQILKMEKEAGLSIIFCTEDLHTNPVFPFPLWLSINPVFLSSETHLCLFIILAH